MRSLGAILSHHTVDAQQQTLLKAKLGLVQRWYPVRRQFGLREGFRGLYILKTPADYFSYLLDTGGKEAHRLPEALEFIT